MSSENQGFKRLRNIARRFNTGRRKPAKLSSGKCYVPVGEGCFEPQHLHGGELFTRMFNPASTAKPRRVLDPNATKHPISS